MQFYSKRAELIFSFAYHSEITFCNSLYRQISHVTTRESNEGKCMDLHSCDPIQFCQAVEPAVLELQRLFMDTVNSTDSVIISANFQFVGCCARP